MSSWLNKYDDANHYQKQSRNAVLSALAGLFENRLPDSAHHVPHYLSAMKTYVAVGIEEMEFMPSQCTNGSQLIS